MKILLVDKRGKTMDAPYILRLPGWTEERYYREAPREGKCEFVKGDLIVMTPMSEDHSDVVNFLGFLLTGYVNFNHLGKVLPGVTLRLEPDVNREPDLCFIPQDRVSPSKTMPLKVIPSFIIEVCSTTHSIDLGEKVFDYERAGVEEYWVVDIEQNEVTTHHQQKGKYKKGLLKQGRLSSRAIEGFHIDIDWLWQDPLPSAFECLRKLIGF